MSAPATRTAPQPPHSLSDPSTMATDAELPPEHHHCDHNDHTEHETPTAFLTIHFRGAPHSIAVPAGWTLSELAGLVEETYTIPASKQKYMVTPKGGTYKHPFPSSPSAQTLREKKIVLLGTPDQEIANLQDAIHDAQQALQRRRVARGNARAHQPSVARRTNWKTASQEAQYTFHAIKPLPYLPNPSRSQRFLERLASDPGIKASMLKHHFSVGLLTEMDPAMHTTHESRTLGLNRNRGEVIELRLRTDAYDGYRDYRTIRKTLCHELSHNVWGDHDRNFWDLTKEIEREVERNDWSRGGSTVGGHGAEFYNPDDSGIDDEDLMDEGGWTGGEFVLGGLGSSGAEGQGLSRREILAKAAEERARKAREAKGDGEGPSSSPS